MRWLGEALLAALIFAAGWSVASVYWAAAYAPEVAKAQALAVEAERIKAEVARVRAYCGRFRL